MIYVIDGGSLLNQQSHLFNEMRTLHETIRDFFERFAPKFAGCDTRLVFILKGHDKGSNMPPRHTYGRNTVIFSNSPGEEEDLILESVESAVGKGDCTLVSDNFERVTRAEFLGAEIMSCEDFAKFLRGKKTTTGDIAVGDKNIGGNVEYWSNVFGVSSKETFELKARPKKDDASVEKEEQDK